MDARARLDYALFQLTPTRTRCDLVIFHGGKSEKLASGLFQPFVSHLKSVKDEISRGGYSIALRPPTQNAHWFTKATFQRFVRFVSTPAVLERFVSIEREILQIESSVQLEEGFVSTDLSTRKSSDSLKKRGELGEADDAVENENSKVCLQRVLETRVALLRKQQAMAYARGLVAGFEIYSMDDLISFSDAFGASRLRDACINFKDLYNKKHKDGLWIEELAAMAACPPSDLQFTAASGITLANETDAINQNVLLNLPHANAPTSEKAQVPMSFPAQSPQYYYGSVGHTNQFPPYHGYPFPAMQPFPPHYPMNLQWPSNIDVQKSSSRRRKSGNRKVESSDSSTSVSASDSDTQQDKKQSDVENSSKNKFRKKSNRKVVIQNINYITPKKKDGNKGEVSDESVSDEEAEVLEMSHEPIVEKSHGVLNGSSSEDLTVNALSPIDVEGEHFIVRSEGGNSFSARPNLGLNSERIPRKLTAAADPLAVLEKNGRNDDRVRLEGFENEENFSSLKEKNAYADEGKLLSLRLEESGTHIGSAFSAGAAESTITKSSRGEDWFVVNHSENTENHRVRIKQTVFDGDHNFASERKGVSVDDSFFIQTRSAADDVYESSWITDLSMDNDLSLAAAHKENGLKDIPQNTSEPNDLSMILERESNLESSTVSWSMDYAAEVSFPEANRRWSDAEKTDDADKKPDSNGVMNTDVKKNIKVPGTKDRSKEARSNVVRRHSIGSHISDVKTKRTPLTTRPIVRKTKFEMEEEIRQKMEALQLERQKRIAEKTAEGGLAPVAPRRASLESKAAKGSSIKSDKGKLQSTKRSLHL